MDKITCIYCGREFEISDALREHIRSEEIDKINKRHDEEVAKLKDVVRKAEEQELSIRKQKEVLEERERKFELEKQRQLDEERKKIREETMKEADEQAGMKLKERDLVIERLTKQMEEMKRTAAQGSQQSQGEVQELDIETTLREAFPNDDIIPVEKGELGGDCTQVVKSPSGKTVCGKILWESKRTKNWTDGWIPKLKEDQRRSGADMAAIISQVLPKETTEEIFQVDGVWVTKRNLMIPMAMLLRETLINVAYQKTAQMHQGRKADLVYDYVTSAQFRQQVGAIVEAYRDMHEQIGRERAAYDRMWKAREAQLGRIITATANVYGSMQGLAGNNALPEVSGLSLPEPD
jgi:hypothetical protein